MHGTALTLLITDCPFRHPTQPFMGSLANTIYGRTNPEKTFYAILERYRDERREEYVSTRKLARKCSRKQNRKGHQARKVRNIINTPLSNAKRHDESYEDSGFSDRRQNRASYHQNKYMQQKNRYLQTPLQRGSLFTGSPGSGSVRSITPSRRRGVLFNHKARDMTKEGTYTRLSKVVEGQGDSWEDIDIASEYSPKDATFDYQVRSRKEGRQSRLMRRTIDHELYSPQDLVALKNTDMKHDELEFAEFCDQHFSSSPALKVQKRRTIASNKSFAVLEKTQEYLERATTVRTNNSLVGVNANSAHVPPGMSRLSKLDLNRPLPALPDEDVMVTALRQLELQSTQDKEKYINPVYRNSRNYNTLQVPNSNCYRGGGVNGELGGERRVRSGPSGSNTARNMELTNGDFSFLPIPRPPHLQETRAVSSPYPDRVKPRGNQYADGTTGPSTYSHQVQQARVGKNSLLREKPYVPQTGVSGKENAYFGSQYSHQSSQHKGVTGQKTFTGILNSHYQHGKQGSRYSYQRGLQQPTKDEWLHDRVETEPQELDNPKKRNLLTKISNLFEREEKRTWSGSTAVSSRKPSYGSDRTEAPTGPNFLRVLAGKPKKLTKAAAMAIHPANLPETLRSRLCNAFPVKFVLMLVS